jgi:hypothetical protein
LPILRDLQCWHQNILRRNGATDDDAFEQLSLIFLCLRNALFETTRSSHSPLISHEARINTSSTVINLSNCDSPAARLIKINAFCASSCCPQFCFCLRLHRLSFALFEPSEARAFHKIQLPKAKKERKIRLNWISSLVSSSLNNRVFLRCSFGRPLCFAYKQKRTKK